MSVIPVSATSALSFGGSGVVLDQREAIVVVQGRFNRLIPAS
jgi:hypothetical protein